MKLNFKPASAEDIYLLFQIKKQSLKPYIQQVWGWDEATQFNYFRGQFNPGHISIIITDGKPIGFIETIQLADTLTINNLLIVESHQGLGIGSSILKDLITSGRYKRLQLEVLRVNHRAQKLYTKLGFQIYEETDLKIKMFIDTSTSFV